jgi:4-aminobutyrate---pyruvate transaminase
VTYIANSIEARDIASLVHMQTNLRRHQQEGPLVIARGKGCRVFDDNGRDYIESVAGLWCASLGFNSERLARVAHEQMRRLGYYHLYRHRSNEPAIELAETLLKIAPVPMARVVFQCSGSEANDTAIKLAWYYWNAMGRPQRTKIIARHMAYHGNTCAAVSLSGKPDMHAGFGLPFSPFKHTEFPHYYRRHEQGETELAFSDRMAEALEALIQLEGPDTIAAFFAEPVMGAGGAIVPPLGYFEKIQAVLRKHSILFVADEVICGFARTGEMWGSQTYQLAPDMVTSAKALSAAMQPISAVLVNNRIHEAMLAQSDKLGNFAHGYTYAGHPVAAAVALEVQKIYAELDIVGRAKRLGPVLQSTLGRLKAHSLVGDVQGTGLILGMELMHDGQRRIAFEPTLNVGGRVDAAAKRHGLILRVVGDRLVFAPPLVIEASEIEEIGERLERALDDVAHDLGREGALR